MNKLLRFVFMAVLAMSFSSLFATNVTINTNSTSTTWTTEKDKYSGVIGNFKITCSKGTATSLGNAASSDYIQIKNNNVLTIEETSGLTITKVVLHVKQGATIKVNGTSISKATDNTFTWGGKKNTTKFEALNEGTPIKLISIDITYGAADPNAVAAPTFDAVTPFVGKGLVTIKGVEGSVVYYTTDGSVPTTSSSNNGTASVDVEVTETTTIKAIAVKNGKESVMVSKDFICYQVKTIAQLNELTTDLSNVALKLTNAKVVYDFLGYYIYVREGEYAVRFDGVFSGKTGIANLKNYVVNGTILVNFVKNFGDCTLAANNNTNISDLTLTESSEEAEPVVTTIPEVLAKKHIEDLIALKSVTITSRKENNQPVYDLTDEDGNVVTAPTCNSEDVATKADDGNKYDVKAIFESVNNEGKPQLTLLGFYEIANGITSVTRQKSNSDATIYNMSGQRVGKSYKGLVVKAGKKYIAK